MNKFYVYAHYKPNSNIPFYIGKGYKNRAYSKRNRNKHWYNIVKKHGPPIVEIIYDKLSEQLSLDLETSFICSIGRFDLGEGPLVNMTDGGDGVSGLNKGPCSNKQKNKISRALTGRFLSNEHRYKLSIANKGKRRSEKQKQDQSKRMTGKKRKKYKLRSDIGKKRTPFSETSKHNMSIAHKGKLHTSEYKRNHSIRMKSWWKQRKKDLKHGTRKKITYSIY